MKSVCTHKKQIQMSRRRLTGETASACSGARPLSPWTVRVMIVVIGPCRTTTHQAPGLANTTTSSSSWWGWGGWKWWWGEITSRTSTGVLSGVVFTVTLSSTHTDTQTHRPVYCTSLIAMSHHCRITRSSADAAIARHAMIKNLHTDYSNNSLVTTATTLHYFCSICKQTGSERESASACG